MENETMFTRIVGSHLWGMNTTGSDIDYYECYIAPTRDFLIGKTHMKGRQQHNSDTDTASFEIGHVIGQLKKGNLNHIIGVMSNMVVYRSPISLKLGEIRKLRYLVEITISKNCYHSIAGMTKHNYKKYLEDKPKKHLDPKAYQKKLNQIARVIRFGINILRNGEISFERTEVKSKFDIERLQRLLHEAYEDSDLPDKPDEKRFDDFLYKLRIDRL